MGVLPLEFQDEQNRKTLKLNGREKIYIKGVKNIKPHKILKCEIHLNKKISLINLKCRIDTQKEFDYYKAGGILNYVLNSILDKAS